MTTLLIATPASLVGCIDPDCGRKCTAPQEAIVELATLGTTITQLRNPAPESVEQILDGIGGEQYVSGRLSLYFSPHPEFEKFESLPTSSSFIAPPYDFIYSYEADGSFIVIPPRESEAGDNPAHYYYGILTANNHSQELVISGDYFLEHAGLFTAPVNATHIELWFRRQPDMERELVRRVPLDSLYAWNKYMVPLIN